MQLNNEIAHEEVTQGKYQVSIGTSLALETLFGINDNIPPTDPLPYKQYSYLLINLRTLIRNMYGAVQKELKTEWSAGRYYEKVLKELVRKGQSILLSGMEHLMRFMKMSRRFRPESLRN